MSKTSRFLIFVMVCGLAFLAGLRAYQVYEKRVAEASEDINPTVTFQNTPALQPLEVPDYGVYQPLPADIGRPKEIYLEDIALEPEQARQQARETLTSIMDDYRANPKMKAFYADIQKATSRTDITLETLSSEGLPQLMQQYPQLQEVMVKYAKDPEFAKTLQEIFSNPQFMQSVAVLQTQDRAQL